MSSFLDHVFLLAHDRRGPFPTWCLALDEPSTEGTKTRLGELLARHQIPRVILAGAWSPALLFSYCQALFDQNIEILLAHEALTDNHHDASRWMKTHIQIQRLGGSYFSIGQLTTLLLTHRQRTALVCTELNHALQPLLPVLPK